MIKTSPVQRSAPPLAPAIPGGTTVSSRVLNNTPMSAQEVGALQARRRVLSEQLTSADGRRKELSRLARNAIGAGRPAPEQVRVPAGDDAHLTARRIAAGVCEGAISGA